MKRMNALLSRMHTFNKIWNMLTHPQRTYEKIREEPLTETFKYFLLLLSILTLILLIGGAFVVSWLVTPLLEEHQLLAWVGVILIVPVLLVTGFIILILGGLILHFFVRLLGGKRGLRQTYKALAYGSTPVILSLWFLPVVMITMIWSLALIVIGVRNLQKMTTFRASMSVFLPLILVLVLAFASRMLL